MLFVTKANILLSQLFWENLSEDSQKNFCRVLTSIYNLGWTRLLIGPFCKRYHISDDRLLNYTPASGGDNFQSFQDFFTRKLKNGISIKSTSKYVYPCEGYVCDSGVFGELNLVDVKGNSIHPKKIFGRFEKEINDQDYFLNIFLHNHNYHRFHSPCDATIVDIERIPGKLLFLRPWFYSKSKVSTPAFLNERVNIKIKDNNQKTWLISFVAGMGVGNIQIDPAVKIGCDLKIGQELGLFLLGSTCCLSVPYQLSKIKYMESISIAQDLF